MSFRVQAPEPAAPGIPPIADLLIETRLTKSGDQVALSGAQCRACGGLSFPDTPACCRCGAMDTESVALARTGVVYTYSTVHVSSSRQTPYTIGYVDLEDGVRVLAELRGELQIGSRVTLQVSEGAWFFTAEEDGR